MPLSYGEALGFLFPRTTTIKFGLETTRALLESLGNPQAIYPTVHIGGTNGKGSVAALVASALEEAGWRVGLYTSPHLVSFRERITVNGVPVSEDAVACWTDRLLPLLHRHQATFFEASTALAFADFAARGAEIAVIEVGLGGRLDSTNVITPLASGVTHIAWDHMKYLGNTLEAIAREKAGIAKPGVPFIIGERDPALAAVIRHEAGRLEAHAHIHQVPPERRWEGPLGLVGPHQRRNAAVAEALLQALPPPWRPAADEIRRGFGRTRVAGRFDRRGKWLFDVAHNADGMGALLRALETEPPRRPLHALVSILGDKPWAEMLVLLDTVIDRGILTFAPTAADRGWDADWLQDWLHRADRPPARAQWSLVAGFEQAIAQVQEGAGTVLVTGSFHTVGDVMDVLGLGAL